MPLSVTKRVSAQFTAEPVVKQARMWLIATVAHARTNARRSSTDIHKQKKKNNNNWMKYAYPRRGYNFWNQLTFCKAAVHEVNCLGRCAPDMWPSCCLKTEKKLLDVFGMARNSCCYIIQSGQTKTKPPVYRIVVMQPFKIKWNRLN